MAPSLWKLSRGKYDLGPPYTSHASLDYHHGFVFECKNSPYASHSVTHLFMTMTVEMLKTCEKVRMIHVA